MNAVTAGLTLLCAAANEIGCDRIDIRGKADGRVEAECVGHNGSPFALTVADLHIEALREFDIEHFSKMAKDNINARRKGR